MTDPRVYEKYSHCWSNKAEGASVFVRADLKGRHREHCLCYAPCANFHPGDPDNCPRAQALYEFDVKWDMVTPVWECPAFREVGPPAATNAG